MSTQQIVNDLRKQLQQTDLALNNCRRLLDAERIENNQLTTILSNAKRECTNLQIANNDLIRQLQIQQNADVNDPIIPKKRYESLKTYACKRQRKSKYWEVLNSGMCRITECTRATVTLSLGSQTIHLQWTEQEMDASRRRLSRSGFVIPPFNEVHNQDDSSHPLASDAQTQRQDKPLKITFNQREIRKTVVTLDNQRISQPAYHELRMELNPLMPPLHLVKEEKKAMSSKLKYYLVDGVSISCFREGNSET